MESKQQPTEEMEAQLANATTEAAPAERGIPTDRPSTQTGLRPRLVVDTKRVVQRGQSRLQQQRRPVREVLRTRGLEASARPSAAETGLIDRQSKRDLDNLPRPVAPSFEPKPVAMMEDRESVKLASWLALFVALVSLFLTILYSQKDFGFHYDFTNIEGQQQKLRVDLVDLQNKMLLQDIKDTVLQAHFYLLTRRDYDTAETLLAKAKQDLNALSQTLTVNGKQRAENLLAELQKVINEVQNSRSTFDERLQKIFLNLEKLP